VLDFELERPAVDSDQLVAPGGFSMPLEDVIRLETRGFSLDRTVLLVLGTVVIVPVVLVGGYMILCPDAIIGGGVVAISQEKRGRCMTPKVSSDGSRPHEALNARG
jgi:hypothetical protein